jgi:hypothetical protein
MGRPAVVQDTGFSALFPCGQGLLAFKKPNEAIAAIKSLRSDYACHSRRSRQIAEQFFDAGKVLTDLLERSF